MTNGEAVSNIGANLSEIVGIATGIMLFVGAVVIKINRYPGYAKRMSIAGAILFALALITPGVVNFLQPVSMLASIVFGWCVCLAILGSFFFVYFLPWSIASKRNTAHQNWIKILNIMFLVPLNWLIALSWASLPDKDDESE